MRPEQAINILLRMQGSMLHALGVLPTLPSDDEKLMALRNMLLAQVAALDMAVTAIRGKK